jgi:hypothetical protein
VTNLRLAKHLRMAGARTEVAVTIQALEGEHYEFIQPGVNDPVVPVVPRRVFLTLRTEF